ncbi:branched-chain amino acid ABC transporter permease [Nonomuraea sp. NPDC059194]|uniref:branched-chain amino acid ABC transporter permease n=1 Tax=Nonomuraea sp. NPDC059194 TaxID=3346764 RepID=UPI0036B95135
MRPYRLLPVVVVAVVVAILATAVPALATASDEWGFRGLLRDGTRKPVAGVTVQISTGGTVLGGDVTDDAGRWGPIAVPGPGSYRISAGDLEVTRELRDDPTTLKIQNIVLSTDQDVTDQAGRDTLGTQLAQRAAAGLNLGLLIAIAAIGLSLVFGVARFTNFAHGENVTFGGVIGFLFASVLGLPLLAAMVLATVAGAAFGYAQDLALWRPLRRRGVSLVTLMIASIGVGLALRSAIQFFYGNAAQAISREDWGVVTLGPVTMPATNYASMAISVAVLVAVGLWLKRGRLGKAVRAISDNSPLAAVTGIDVGSVTRLVWVVSGALAGALVVGLCTELLVLWIPTDMKYTGGLAILIVVLLVRPQGIFGRRERVG